MRNDYTMSGAQYDKLYARYLKRSPKELFDYACEDLKGKSVLDLCAGSNARASLIAAAAGASPVIAVDRNPSIQHIEDERIEGLSADVGEFCRMLKNQNVRVANKTTIFTEERYFDVVICQQGINYWIETIGVLENLAAIMNDDGVFVFNTFSKKHQEDPLVRGYEIDGVKYVEVSSIKDDWIEHAQFVTGMKPHFTKFRWVSHEKIMALLNPYFDNVMVDFLGKTDIYVCKK